MRTSEFIKKVNELGYEFEITDYRINVLNGNDLVVRVYEHLVNALDTNFGEYVTYMLFDLCVEYARTPIEERKDVKRYYLRFPNADSEGFAYLNLNLINSKKYFFGSIKESAISQTKFTQEEIDNLPNQDFIKGLIKEDV